MKNNNTLPKAWLVIYTEWTFWKFFLFCGKASLVVLPAPVTTREGRHYHYQADAAYGQLVTCSDTGYLSQYHPILDVIILLLYTTDPAAALTQIIATFISRDFSNNIVHRKQARLWGCSYKLIWMFSLNLCWVCVVIPSIFRCILTLLLRERLSFLFID